jgi:hypothetical protein
MQGHPPAQKHEDAKNTKVSRRITSCVPWNKQKKLRRQVFIHPLLSKRLESSKPIYRPDFAIGIAIAVDDRPADSTISIPFSNPNPGRPPTRFRHQGTKDTKESLGFRVARLQSTRLTTASDASDPDETEANWLKALVPSVTRHLSRSAEADRPALAPVKTPSSLRNSRREAGRRAADVNF